jgi:hypothetical protein
LLGFNPTKFSYIKKYPSHVCLEIQSSHVFFPFREFDVNEMGGGMIKGKMSCSHDLG